MLNRSTRGLANRLLRLNHDDLALALGHIANEAKIPTTTIQRARTELPSFSAHKWSKYAKQFDMSTYPSLLEPTRLATFKTPTYHLPPSLHVSMFKNAWLWNEVYNLRQTECPRILDPYIVPLVALFQGRVLDVPQDTMLETKYSTGNQVEHNITMLGETFLVIRLDLGVPDGSPLARMLLDLVSAAELNKWSVQTAGRRVYGLSIGAADFRFLSYDPANNRFYFDEGIVVNSGRRGLSAMMTVANKIFSVMLSSYIDVLRANIKSEAKVAHDNLPELIGKEKNINKRVSADPHQAALILAERCRAKFEEPVGSFQDMEEKGNKALKLLEKSVCSIPRASRLMAAKDDDLPKPAELKKLATRVTRETHEGYLSESLNTRYCL